MTVHQHMPWVHLSFLLLEKEDEMYEIDIYVEDRSASEKRNNTGILCKRHANISGHLMILTFLP